MAASLLDSLSGLVTPGIASKAASLLGESDSAIRKGIGGTFPVLLSGIANRAGDAGFASSLFDLVRSPDNDGSILNDASSLLGASSTSPVMGLGGKLLGSVFGSNTGNVANALSSYAGVRSSSASALMNLAAPLLLGVLGKRARSEGLNAASLASLLRGQKDTFAAALPGPLASIRNYLPGETVALETRERDYIPPPTQVTRERSSPWKWVLPAVAALGVIWLLSSLLGRDRAPETARVPVATTPAPTPPLSLATAPPATATLPTASVYFDVNQSALPTGSDSALSGVITYLRANPGSTAAISGYHDATGDRTNNEDLARDRAGSVRAALVAAGIEESRISMDRPVETTGGGTAQDARRVEVTVR